jgi:hypothetical protein
LKSFWETTIDGVVVGDNHPIQFRTNTGSAIIDTGTTVIVGDENDVKEIYAQIPGSLPADPKYDLGEGVLYKFVRSLFGLSGLLMILCIGSVPCNFSTSLVFGGKKFSMSPETFNQGSIDNSTNLCVGAIQYDPNFPKGESKNELGGQRNRLSDCSVYRAKRIFYPGSLRLHPSKTTMWCLMLANIRSALLNLPVTISSPTPHLCYIAMPCYYVL